MVQPGTLKFFECMSLYRRILDENGITPIEAEIAAMRQVNGDYSGRVGDGFEDAVAPLVIDLVMRTLQLPSGMRSQLMVYRSLQVRVDEGRRKVGRVLHQHIGEIDFLVVWEPTLTTSVASPQATTTSTNSATPSSPMTNGTTNNSNEGDIGPLLPSQRKPKSSSRPKPSSMGTKGSRRESQIIAVVEAKASPDQLGHGFDQLRQIFALFKHQPKNVSLWQLGHKSPLFGDAATQFSGTNTTSHFVGMSLNQMVLMV
jgi:hypothetical protein